MIKKSISLFLLCFLYCIGLVNAAPLSDFRIATWNLQGSSASNESKWNINVRQLITGHQSADILMVQEAGSLPATAQRTARVVQPVGVGIPIDEYLWNLGTARRPNNVYIYYSRVDVGANRVNLAIVSRYQAEEVFVIAPTTSVLQARPAIGIRVGDNVFFSAHALSSGGADAPSLITNIFHFFMQTQERRGLSWIVVGDFNRNPLTLERALQREPGVGNNTFIVAPAEPTHRSGSILDYAVVHDASLTTGHQQNQTLNASLMFNQVRSQITSDHFPVSFVKDR